MCDDWQVFNNFVRDMGIKPDGMSIDRIENSLGYSKDNCRWATAVEQNDNLDKCFWLVVDGKRMTRAQASLKYNIGKNTLLSRLRAGWSDEDACKRPVGPNNGRIKKTSVRDPNRV